jgi:uncharacterized membrane protein YqjE
VISDSSPPLPPAARGLLQVALEALRTRLDLAAVELEIQLLLLVRLFAWFLGALACAVLGLLCAATALIVALWNTHRMLGLLGGSLVFLALAALLGYLGLRTLRRESGPLEGSLGQLAEDARRAGGAL